MSVNLTIVIPVYNSQKYLFDCLNSVCKQVKKNVEVIIVDDFSIDNSIKISKNRETVIPVHILVVYNI